MHFSLFPESGEKNFFIKMQDGQLFTNREFLKKTPLIIT